MFSHVEEHQVGCPYCGEVIGLLIDPSIPTQSYIEDCEVCCRPIVVTAVVREDGEIIVGVRQEDD